MPPTVTDLQLQYLLSELARIDVLVRREVWRWQLAGQDPADDFRGLYVSDGDARALVERPFGTSWGQTVTLDVPQASAFVAAQKQAADQSSEIAAAMYRNGKVPRLEQLVTAFRLEPFDRDAFLICLAPDLDLRYEQLYGYLQDDITRKHPSLNLILDLLCRDLPERLARQRELFSDSPLFRHRLVKRLPGPDDARSLRRTLAADKTVVTWLLGGYRPHPDLRPHTQLHALAASSRALTGELLLVGETWQQLASRELERPLIAFFGPDELAQRACARLIAGQLEQPLLDVDLPALAGEDPLPLEILRLALRDARLTGAVPFLRGWDACLKDGSPPADFLSSLCEFPGPLIVAGTKAWQPRGLQRSRRTLSVEFPVPDVETRRGLWSHFLGQPHDEAEIALSDLAGQFALTSQQIRDAAALALDSAVKADRSVEAADLLAAARACSNPRLSGLARQIQPRYVWDDIVLPTDQIDLLHEIVAAVRERPRVLDEWGLARKLVPSRGITALFSGAPGTGKTMAAEIIAGELGLDLYKIDLSTVVSKYIGETEKNLERVFMEAASSNAILFFDEADALFGKRSEVRDSHDRYANLEISYLLQRMEAYDGVTILATNLRANLDEAFTRRLQFAVDFPFPKEDDRLRIWRALFPADLPISGDLDFEMLARRYKLAGGNIRNILVGAAYLAAADGGAVTMGNLMHGTRRELQKMGKMIEERIYGYGQET